LEKAVGAKAPAKDDLRRLRRLTCWCGS